MRALSHFTLEVEHLTTEVTDVAHVSRIKPYWDSLVGQPVELSKVSEFLDRIWYAVLKIEDFREEFDCIERLVGPLIGEIFLRASFDNVRRLVQPAAWNSIASTLYEDHEEGKWFYRPLNDHGGLLCIMALPSRRGTAAWAITLYWPFNYPDLLSIVVVFISASPFGTFI